MLWPAHRDASRSMKTPFLATPNWNYERMALAAIVAATCIAMAFMFASMALQLAAFVPGAWSFPPRAVVLQLWAHALAAAALLSVGIAFVCFTAIKISPRHHERYYSMRRQIRRFGLVWLRIAVILAGLWVVVNIALQVAW